MSKSAESIVSGASGAFGASGAPNIQIQIWYLPGSQWVLKHMVRIWWISGNHFSERRLLGGKLQGTDALWKNWQKTFEEHRRDVRKNFFGFEQPTIWYVSEPEHLIFTLSGHAQFLSSSCKTLNLSIWLSLMKNNNTSPDDIILVLSGNNTPLSYYSPPPPVSSKESFSLSYYHMLRYMLPHLTTLYQPFT